MSAPRTIDDPDQNLIDRARDGDLAAFDDLVRKYSQRLYSHVYHMTSNREDAYDLLQDIFAKAYRSLRKFQGKSTFYTWIYSIATNMTINHLKKKKRKAAMSLDDIDNGIANDVVFTDTSATANPRRGTTIKEIQKKLNEAMQLLSEDHRTVVALFDIEGLPHAEIAQILNISPGTVRSRLHYAHKHLQSLLADYL